MLIETFTVTRATSRPVLEQSHCSSVMWSALEDSHSSTASIRHECGINLHIQPSARKLKNVHFPYSRIMCLEHRYCTVHLTRAACVFKVKETSWILPLSVNNQLVISLSVGFSLLNFNCSNHSPLQRRRM